MKKWIKLFMMTMFGITIMAGMCQSCEKWRVPVQQPEQKPDAELVAEVLPEAMKLAYSFPTALDAVFYKQERLEQLRLDSIFTNLPDQTIANIVGVLQKDGTVKSVTISDIVHEYEANQRIYDGLPSPPPSIQIDAGTAEVDPKPDSITQLKCLNDSTKGGKK